MQRKPKSKLKKALALLLALLTAAAMLAACGDGGAPTGGNDKPNTSGTPGTDKPDTDKPDTDKPDTDKPDTPDTSGTPGTSDGASSDPAPDDGEGLHAQKIGSLTGDKHYTFCRGGIIYTSGGKYGIMTLDGKQDTGEKYVACEELEEYFQVSLKKTADSLAPADLNCTGVVDVTGKEIVPMKYATVDCLGDRYIRVCEVTEQTDNKDEALVYYTESFFSLGVAEGDICFKGNWYVYDVTTGKPLEGVTGTHGYRADAFGNFLEYVTDAGEKITVNDKGETLPKGATLFQNGCYAIAEGNVGAVYDENGSKLFEYAPDGCLPKDVDASGEYFIASQYTDVRKYVILDRTGKTVSAEFPESPNVYGKFIHVGEKLYDFAGKVAVEGEYTNVYPDKRFGRAWFLRKDSTYTVIDGDGKVLCTYTEDDSISVYSSDCAIKKTVDGKSMYYSFKDGDFTLEGNSAESWLIQQERPNGIYDLVDSLTGKTVLRGYSGRYSCIATRDGIYVYAKMAAKMADDSCEIFTVK